MNHQISRTAVAKSLLVLAMALALTSAVSSAAPKIFMHLYIDGEVFRTFGVPARTPHGGNDPLFTFTEGADGQLSISQFGPGDREFSGGSWAVYDVTWKVEPYLLTSYEELIDAAMAGDVTITRDAASDFRCPVLP
jgi:hypothetical protein